MKKFLLIIFCCGMAFKASAMKVDTSLLHEMLETLNAEYLYEIDKPQLIADGLQILADFDKQFTVSKGTDRIYIYHRGKIAAVLPFPHNLEDMAAWSAGVDDILQTAAKVSENIALHDYELPDLMLKKWHRV